jgi:hypothetical protein
MMSGYDEEYARALVPIVTFISKFRNPRLNERERDFMFPVSHHILFLH